MCKPYCSKDHRNLRDVYEFPSRPEIVLVLHHRGPKAVYYYHKAYYDSNNRFANISRVPASEELETIPDSYTEQIGEIVLYLTVPFA